MYNLWIFCKIDIVCHILELSGVHQNKTKVSNVAGKHFFPWVGILLIYSKFDHFLQCEIIRIKLNLVSEKKQRNIILFRIINLLN